MFLNNIPRHIDFDLVGKSAVGRGGMSAKVAAAANAVNSSPATKAAIIASGHYSDTLLRIVRGDLVGTLFQKEMEFNTPAIQRMYTRYVAFFQVE